MSNTNQTFTNCNGMTTDNPNLLDDAITIDCTNPPQSIDQLVQLVRALFGVRLVQQPVISTNQAPLDYLAHAFFAGRICEADLQQQRMRIGPTGPSSVSTPGSNSEPDRTHHQRAAAMTPVWDCLVWANRGGGKTFLGALATALDLLFKPGIEIRVLGGSLEQSQRLHAHLRRFLDPARHPALAGLVEKMSERRIVMANGATVEMMAQSHTSVRGTRVQVLRCDEVDLFDPDVWDAAQLVTRAAVCGTFSCPGHVECLSTMHLPHGVMHRLVAEARTGTRRMFRWGLVDVLTRCEPTRPCTDGTLTAPASMNEDPGVLREPTEHECPLHPECGGRAKLRPPDEAGHITVDEATAMKRRVPLTVWGAEMLCLRPSRTLSVIPEFDSRVHVFSGPVDAENAAHWVGGMDFGFRVSVVLWAQVDRAGRLRIVDERIMTNATLESQLREIRDRLAQPGVPAWPMVEWIAADPAGVAANEHTGEASVSALRQVVGRVETPRMPVQAGVRMIRARLAPAAGGRPRLLVHARCQKLIESLERHRYRPGVDSLTPEKDGTDHAVDALRYLVTQLDKAPGEAPGEWSA